MKGDKCNNCLQYGYNYQVTIYNNDDKNSDDDIAYVYNLICETECARKRLCDRERKRIREVKLVKWVHILVDKCKRRRKFHCLVHRMQKLATTALII